MIIEWIIAKLHRLFARQAVYYIGGSEILPPPLSPEEEAAGAGTCSPWPRLLLPARRATSRRATH